MNTPPHLLSEEEWLDAIEDLHFNYDDVTYTEFRQQAKEFFALIQQQKRLHGEWVIGADETPTHPNEVIPYKIRKEQRREQHYRNQEGK